MNKSGINSDIRAVAVPSRLRCIAALALFIIGGSTASGVAAPGAINRGTMSSDIYLPAVITPSARNLTNLIQAYKTDPYSTYHKGVFVTRQNADGLLRRMDREHGHELIANIGPRTVIAWHHEWLGPDETHVTMAHSLIGCLRRVVRYGSTMLQMQECGPLKETLSGLRFPNSKPRTVAITAEQVIVVREMAHKMGFHSVALGQAFQFCCIFRQKDVIGEYVPLTEKVQGLLVAGDQKWLRGIHWGEVSPDLILKHVTSKRQKLVIIDLKLAPMILQEFKLLKDEQVLRGGPIIICEATGLPYTNVRYRRTWRTIARAAGIPDNVRNMDSRAGGITESFQLGASGSQVRKSATHSQQSQTDAYNRGDTEDIAAVMRLRAAKHEQLMGDAA